MDRSGNGSGAEKSRQVVCSVSPRQDAKHGIRRSDYHLQLPEVRVDQETAQGRRDSPNDADRQLGTQKAPHTCTMRLPSNGLGLSFAKNRLAQFLIAVAPGLLVIFGWRLYLKLVHISLPSDFARPSLSLLRENAGRMGEILAILLAEMSETEDWSIFWLLTAVALVYLSASRKLEKLALASAVIVPALLYALIYLFSTWPSYSAHMTSSFPRLVLQVMPTGWLAIGLA